MRLVIAACLLFLTAGLTGCDPGPKSDPQFEKKKANQEELKKLEDPTNKEQKIAAYLN